MATSYRDRPDSTPNHGTSAGPAKGAKGSGSGGRSGLHDVLLAGLVLVIIMAGGFAAGQLGLLDGSDPDDVSAADARLLTAEAPQDETATTAVVTAAARAATTSAPTKTNTPRPTATPTPTKTNTPRPTATPTPKKTNTPRPTATPTPKKTNTPRPTATPTPKKTNTPRPTATPTPRKTSTPTPAFNVTLSSPIRQNLSRGQMLPVYSGPGTNYYRGANGRAECSTNAAIYIWGYENGWLMISYGLNAGGSRVGYVRGFRDNLNARELDFAYIRATVTRSVSMTDDPDNLRTAIATLNRNASVTYLATYQGTHGEWYYVEYNRSGTKMRGFIPSGTLTAEN